MELRCSRLTTMAAAARCYTYSSATSENYLKVPWNSIITTLLWCEMKWCRIHRRVSMLLLLKTDIPQSQVAKSAFHISLFSCSSFSLLILFLCRFRKSTETPAQKPKHLQCFAATQIQRKLGLKSIINIQAVFTDYSRCPHRNHVLLSQLVWTNQWSWWGQTVNMLSLYCCQLIIYHKGLANRVLFHLCFTQLLE